MVENEISILLELQKSFLTPKKIIVKVPPLSRLKSSINESQHRSMSLNEFPDRTITISSTTLGKILVPKLSDLEESAIQSLNDIQLYLNSNENILI